MTRAATPLSAIDEGEIWGMAFDYGDCLKPGDTIAAVASVSCTAACGPDTAPGSRLIGTPGIVASPSSGTMGQAVAQVVGNMVGGTIYLLQCFVTTTGGETLSVWGHLTCVAPR